MDPDADPNTPLKDQLQAKVQYQPKDLEKEAQDFVEGLDFFKDPFIFAHDQLYVFLKTLTEKVSPDTQEGDNDNEEEQE